MGNRSKRWWEDSLRDPVGVDPRDLFRLALGLPDAWRVVAIRFDAEQGQLHLTLDFPPGSRFACGTCGQAGLPVYDTEMRKWRHLNFFQYETYLHARVPRVECDRCGVKVTQVPWARPGSGFTLLFEALVLTLAREMPMRAVAQLVGEWDTRLWRVVQHYVEMARARADFSGVRRIGSDETAARRGHHYVTLFVDPDEGRVLYACEGRDSGTVEAFRQDFEAHGGRAEQVTEVTIDMSAAFVKGFTEQFPQAAITFDKFHVMKLLNDAVDEVRRQEQRQRPELRGTRYLWLRNEQDLSPRARVTLEELRRRKLKTARAYAIKWALQGFWDEPADEAEAYLRWWYNWAIRSRLDPVVQAARTIRQHWQGILQYTKTHLTNAILEGINSLVQAAKARARGYRSIRNYITMIYLLAGKLDFHVPPIIPSKRVFAHTY